jgi:peptide deformylase
MTRQIVVTPPHPALTALSDKIRLRKDDQWPDLTVDLVETLVKHQDPPGVGLSAPQIAVNKRAFVSRVGISGRGQEGRVEILLNPRFIYVSDTLTTGKDKLMEGCLSLPGYYGRVARAVEVEVAYWTVDHDRLVEAIDSKDRSRSVPIGLLVEKQERYRDFEARIMQHEMDHLDGILFTQRLLEQGEQLYRAEMGEDGKEVMVAVEM